jgi:hypothetical protein
MRRTVCSIALLALALPLHAADFFHFDELNFFVSHARSLTSPHGTARFRSLHLEFLGESPFIARFIPKAEAGAALTYSDIRQPRSWFGYTYGDPDDSVRGESAFFFIRRSFRHAVSTQPYIEVGTGPMWSNRRVPAATSRLNFHSQLGLGMRLFADRRPLFIEYRFSHISNLAFGDRNPGHGKRNPGWNLNTILIGTRLHKTRR